MRKNKIITTCKYEI